METAVGVARLNPINQLWLEETDAVIRYAQLSEDVVSFLYNPDIEVSYVPPGIWFDPDMADEDCRELMKGEW